MSATDDTSGGEPPALLEEFADGIASLTLNRPALRNPISDPDVIEALTEALERLDADPATRAVIVTGAGAAFSSGGNLKAMAKGAGINDPLPARTRRNYREGIQRLPLLFESLEVPVIAAMNGPAIGAGLDLACMCDLRVASAQARFAASFVKLGLVPGDGGAWLLPRVIGFSRACELVLTGETIDAATALSWGLVSRVVEPGQLMAEARRRAELIASHPPHAIRMTKRLMREASVGSLTQILEMSAAFQAIAHSTHDHEEALTAALGKRAPIFRGM